MLRLFVFCGLIATFLFACNSENNSISVNEFYPFFYPYDTIPKVYVYRDDAHGMDETFHRVYGVKDSRGQFTVVETYSMDGRIIESLTFNVDSLSVYDHMVVKSQQDRIKSFLPKNDFMPIDKKDTGNLIQVIPINDTLAISKEIIRNYSDEFPTKVMGEERNTALFSDFIVMSQVIKDRTNNPSISSGATYYYSEGIGLTRWHTDNKSVDYVLQKIISQNEFIQLMSTK